MGPTGEPDPGDSRRFTSWPQCIGTALSIAVLGALFVGAAQAAEGVVGLAVGLAIALPLVVRSFFLGVTIGPDHVTVRHVFRTRRLTLAEVRQFSILGTPWWVTKLDHQVHVVRRDGTTVPITVMALPQFRTMNGPGRERCAAMNRYLKYQRRR